LIYTVLFLSIYVGSMILGRILKIDGSKLMTPVVLVLIFTVSAWASTQVGLQQLKDLLLYSLIFTTLLVLSTLGLGALLRDKGHSEEAKVRASFPYHYPLALVLGWLFGYFVRFPPYSSAVTYELYVLAAVVGTSIWRGLSLRTVRVGGVRALLSIGVALGGAVVASVAVTPLSGVGFNANLAAALGMGWYSFTGPALAAYVSPYYGVAAFLVNFFREQLTYVLVPAVRRNQVGLLALGGATTMDDTLPVFVSTFGPESGVSAAVNGVLLTLLVPLMVSLAVAL